MSNRHNPATQPAGGDGTRISDLTYDLSYLLRDLSEPSLRRPLPVPPVTPTRFIGLWHHSPSYMLPHHLSPPIQTRRSRTPLQEARDGYGTTPRYAFGLGLGGHFSNPVPAATTSSFRASESGFSGQGTSCGQSQESKDQNEERIRRLEAENTKLRKENEALQSKIVFQDLDLEWYFENTDKLEKDIEKLREVEAEVKAENSRKSAQISALNGSGIIGLTRIPGPVFSSRLDYDAYEMNVFGVAGGNDFENISEAEMDDIQVIMGDSRDFLLHEMMPVETENQCQSVRTATQEDINRIKGKLMCKMMNDDEYKDSSTIS